MLPRRMTARVNGVASRSILAGGLTLLFAFTTLYVAAFSTPRPQEIEVAAVGTAADAQRLQIALDSADRGALDVRRYPTEHQARAALLDTTIHGAVVMDPLRYRVIVAQALGAGPTLTVTDALRRAAFDLRSPAAVEDLRPLPSHDRRGLASLFTIVGTLIPSIVFGVLLSVFGRFVPAATRWRAVVAYGLLAGILVALNVDVIVGALTGHFVGVAIVAALLALAVASTAHGLGHLGGPFGIVTAILLLLLLGLSSAGGAVGYEFEPGFYGAISQLLPPGAALTAIRNVEYFDWAATLAPLLVLGCWALGGLTLGLLGERYGPHVRRSRKTERRAQRDG
jgi:hypothetical protein